MGTIHHHAIIVTSWDSGVIRDAHAFAESIGAYPTDISEAANNGFESFAILPDGSKEGWSASHTGDAIRADLIEWMNRQEYEDGSNRIWWAEVGFGELGNTLKTNAK
jgi:hypothetical protein